MLESEMTAPKIPVAKRSQISAALGRLPLPGESYPKPRIVLKKKENYARSFQGVDDTTDCRWSQKLYGLGLFGQCFKPIN